MHVFLSIYDVGTRQDMGIVATVASTKLNSADGADGNVPIDFAGAAMDLAEWDLHQQGAGAAYTRAAWASTRVNTQSLPPSNVKPGYTPNPAFSSTLLSPHTNPRGAEQADASFARQPDTFSDGHYYPDGDGGAFARPPTHYHPGTGLFGS